VIHGQFESVMVLAAGQGERMQPLTSVLPKPALPTPDGPVIASALRLAARVGSGRVVVNTCHLGGHMAEAITETEIEGIEIFVSHEDELMGTAGGIALARDRGLLGQSGSVLVINGDCALGLQLTGFVDLHHRRDNLVTLALLPHLDPERWSRVVLDSDGSVSAIRPPGSPAALEVPFLYPGVMAVRRDAVDELPSTPGEIPSSLWYPAMATGKLGGVVVAGHWREVGTPADYLEVVIQRLAGSSVIDRSAKVAAGAAVETSFVGRDATVSDGAMIKDSIVAEGAVVGASATVVRSVLLGSIEIPAGSRISSEYLARQRFKV
jgi:NDP-sugar pyrophosphorylase family protein